MSSTIARAAALRAHRGVGGSHAGPASEESLALEVRRPSQGHGDAPARSLAGESRIALAAAVVTCCALTALLAIVGADARWAAALGHAITTGGHMPTGVPYAAAPAAHWPNAIVLAELIFHGLEAALGDRGLMIAQLVAVAVGVSVLARDALASGATPASTAPALLIAAAGAVSCLVVIRLQLFSLAMFPLLAALLRAETRRPSWRVWLVVPLLAVWSNLHGAALIGLGVTLIYLAFERVRGDARTALPAGAAAVAAICLTPVGLHTVAYYHGVLANVAAQRGEGLWAPLSLHAPTDVVLVLAAVALIVRLRRLRPPLWEVLALVALTGLTLKTGRSGIWLLLFLVPLAARGFRPRPIWGRLLPALGTVATLAIAFALVRGPLPNRVDRHLLSRTIAISHGTPVLAEDLLAEQVALAGGRVWMANPIDAFSKRDQAAYLDWLDGKPRALRTIDPHVNVVLVTRGSRAQRLMSRDRRFALIGSARTAVLYLRRLQPGRVSAARTGPSTPAPARAAEL